MATVEMNDRIALPKDVQAADLNYPGRKEHGTMLRTLTLHYVKSHKIDSGWFIANLHISRSRNGSANRTYATRVADGKAGFRIGKGPHVVKTIFVYVTTKNNKRLAALTTMAEAGEQDANMIRDRISSRRAQGALHRAMGHTSWRW